jgi:hypothetical protein
MAISSILARKAPDLQNFRILLNLIFADSRRNVYAGELAVRPARAPTTRPEFEGVVSRETDSYY